MNEREKILAALSAFIRQRPGLEFGNYGDVSAYRSEMRSITKDRHDAERLLAAVSWRESITADDLKDAFRAFSGRLSWDGEKLSYCTGQYFPTEYRKAVCAVLAEALWSHVRDHCMPPKDSDRYMGGPDGGGLYRLGGKWLNAGSWLREHFRREFGARIARRWFD